MNALIRAAALALCCTGAAHAATVNLSYAGMSTLDAGMAVTGTGQFTTKSGTDTGTIGVGDLASFSFSFSFTHDGNTDQFSFDLSDLSCPDNDFVSCDFSATLSDTAVLGLSLTTAEKSAQFNWSQGLTVVSLGQAFTGNFDMPPLSRGTLTATLAQQPGELPEPASWALAALALGGLAAARRRQR